MVLTFYNNESEKNKINKTITQLNTSNIVFLDDTNLIKPILTLKNYQNGNYCRIDNKYYFIDDITKVKNGLTELHLELDVLYTYKDIIINNPCKIIESSDTFNQNKVNYESETVERITEININTDIFNSSTIVLVTVNG